MTDLARIAIDALNTWLETDGVGPLMDAVDMTGILEAAATGRYDIADLFTGCPDCADATYDGICGGCRAEGIALGAGGR